MDIAKASLATDDLSRCQWETVFPADGGGAYILRRASGTRINLVRKRRAWYLRVRLKPHEDLPFTSAQELSEVASMEDRGIYPLDADVGTEAEEGTPVKKMVVPTRPTAAEREEHIA
eukprot:4695340-Pyramimonas_sp.AAC.1